MAGFNILAPVDGKTHEALKEPRIFFNNILWVLQRHSHVVSRRVADQGDAVRPKTFGQQILAVEFNGRGVKSRGRGNGASIILLRIGLN